MPNTRRAKSYRMRRQRAGDGTFLAGSKGGLALDVRAVQDKLVELLKAGNYYFKTACLAAGISPATAYEWLRRGEGRDDQSVLPEYVAFARAVREAEAQAEDEVVQAWVREIPGNWLAARDFLARRFRSRWGSSAPAVSASLDAETGATQLRLTWDEGDQPHGA